MKKRKLMAAMLAAVLALRPDGWRRRKEAGDTTRSQPIPPIPRDRYLTDRKGAAGSEAGRSGACGG